MSSEGALEAWVRVLVERVADAGVCHAVLSPGSRSTPLVWALTRCRRIETTFVVDERSAAFFALGRGRVTNTPTLVVSTSGTAPAHWFPAIIEARLSRVPLVVLSADRPHRHQACGAAQTADQLGLFGSHVRAFFELGAPDGSERGLRALGRVAQQAILASRFPIAGPVHLNAKFDKPLEPIRDDVHGPRADRVLAERRTIASPPSDSPDPQAITEIADECRRASRGIIACGTLPIGQSVGAVISELSRRTGFPVVAEPSSQVRFALPGTTRVIDAFDALARSGPGADLAASADVILRVGEPLVSPAFARIEERRRSIVLTTADWSDPEANADRMVIGDVLRTLEALVNALRDDGPEPTPYAAQWQSANERAWKIVDALLSDAVFGEAHAAREIADGLPRGSLLGIGNSLPIRAMDTFVRARDRGIAVLAQRGANGIDGLVSGAAGAASAHSGRTVLVVGDLAFLHDLGGLLCAMQTNSPLTVIVLNNDGGRIFEELPIARTPDLDLTPWTTPHGLDVSLAGPLFGVASERVRSRESLRSALAASLERPGPTLLAVDVEPTGLVLLRKKLFERVAAEAFA